MHLRRAHSRRHARFPHQRSRSHASRLLLAPRLRSATIDSKLEPQPGEGINANNKKGPGVQKEEPGAGAALPDGAPDFECLKDKDQVRTRTTEALERDCGRDKVFDGILVRGLV